MRYEKGHKQATRHRIVEAASLRFRHDGIESVGVASLMGDIGLTQGGFYNHFDSKDALAREAIVEAMRGTRERLAEVADSGGLPAIIDYYLSAEHRDHRGRGCTAAALATDVARSPPATRSAFTAELRKTIELIGVHLPASIKPKRRRETAQAIFASIMGTLVLARAVDDAALSDSLLAAGRHAARAIAASH
jgi:TetR/AcrR family transcriptional repressor of nem operon